MEDLAAVEIDPEDEKAAEGGGFNTQEPHNERSCPMPRRSGGVPSEDVVGDAFIESSTRSGRVEDEDHRTDGVGVFLHGVVLHVIADVDSPSAMGPPRILVGVI